MKKIFFQILPILVFLVLPMFQTNAQTAVRLLPKTYQAIKTKTAMVIDGKMQEAIWDKAPWTEAFVDIEGDLKPLPPLQTRVKLIWDDSTLYLFAKMEEPQLVASLQQRDDIIFRDNDFEIFMDPDDDTENYYEFEINGYGTVMDLFLDKPYRKGGKAQLGWNAAGLRSAVHISGTLNQPADLDLGWTVEMAIPFSALDKNQQQSLPRKDQKWRLNFSRVEWDYEVVDGQYRKKTIEGHKLKEHNWVWSPQGVVNMHLPEKWGYLIFSE